MKLCKRIILHAVHITTNIIIQLMFLCAMMYPIPITIMQTLSCAIMLLIVDCFLSYEMLKRENVGRELLKDINLSDLIISVFMPLSAVYEIVEEIYYSDINVAFIIACLIVILISMVLLLYRTKLCGYWGRKPKWVESK